MGDRQVLVMFSGGKDSFLTAARAVESGYEVHLISFNNGAVVYEDNLLHGVKRLQGRYGSDVVINDGFYCTASILWTLNEKWTYASWKELGEQYPLLFNAQINCLHCQSAMWVAAIAWCRSKGYSAIMAGYKNFDEFCTGTTQWTWAMKDIAARNGISVKFPLWETPEWGKNKNFGRNLEMIEKFFESSVCEPKCLLGRPVDVPFMELVSELFEYYQDNIEPIMQHKIDSLVPVFRFMKLSSASLEGLHYSELESFRGVF